SYRRAGDRRLRNHTDSRRSIATWRDSAIAALGIGQTNHLGNERGRVAGDPCSRRKRPKREEGGAMMRAGCFHLSRFLRRVMALGALSALSLLTAAQQAPKADAITGRVIGEDGNPVVNASVSAVEAEARGANRIPHMVTTDDEGNFRLTKLPPGKYSVAASA